jgi:uncharacterized protein (DUF1330 family)
MVATNLHHWATSPLSIIEFESREKARQCYQPAQYQAAKAVRLTAGKVNIPLLSGSEI